MMSVKDCWKTFRIFINALPFKVFALFWLLFTLLMMIAFLAPRFDERLFLPVPDSDIGKYRHALTTLVQNNALESMLASSAPLPVKSGKEFRPVLIDLNNTIIGARANERSAIQNFFVNIGESSQPMQKVFYDLQVVGPFAIPTDTLLKNYTLYFVKYVTPQREIVNFVFDNPLVMIFLLMVIISPFLWWLVESIAEPIKHLQDVANDVAQGDFKINKELEITGISEVRQVGESFNRMAEAIGDLISNRQTMLHSISHELRTPLTRLQLSLSLLRRKVGDTKEVQRIQTETERLDKMIRDLLSLSHQHLKSQLIREAIPITEIWDEVKKDLQFEAEHLNIECVFKRNVFYPAQYKISANRESIVSAVENIVRNAIKYAKQRVEITEYLGNGYYFMCVDDDGEGVPSNEYENIFKPFYRVDPDNPNRKEGTGLGLSIVTNVTQQHRGNVWAESSPLGGLRITLQLPLHKS